jgi:hypothetical protein
MEGFATSVPECFEITAEGVPGAVHDRIDDRTDVFIVAVLSSQRLRILRKCINPPSRRA